MVALSNKFREWWDQDGDRGSSWFHSPSQEEHLTAIQEQDTTVGGAILQLPSWVGSSQFPK